ncbi:MAG: hypothetical protein V1756_02115 [Patescibacteria group bacterium]
MLWLLVAISAYFLLAISSLFDRFFLVGPVKNPKAYTFYIGALGVLICLVLLPFGINFPETKIVLFGIFIGLIRLCAMLFLAEGLSRNEVSRVVPAIGGFLPVFSFLLFFLFFPQTDTLGIFQAIAFILLVSGSVLISLREFSLKLLNLKILKFPLLSAFLFALNFLFSKNLFIETDFINGAFLILAGGGIGALLLFSLPGVRRTVFEKAPSQKHSLLLIFAQGIGGLAVLLQYFAVFLAKPSQVPLVNALEGTRDVFLLLFVFILSAWNPKLLKEEVQGKVFLQKIAAVAFIGMGLTILALK